MGTRGIRGKRDIRGTRGTTAADHAPGAYGVQGVQRAPRLPEVQGAPEHQREHPEQGSNRELRTSVLHRSRGTRGATAPCKVMTGCDTVTGVQKVTRGTNGMPGVQSEPD